MHTRYFAPARPPRVRERHAFEALVKRQRNPDKSTTNAAGRGKSRKPVNRGKKEEDEQGAGEREDEDEEAEEKEVEEKEEDEDEDDNGDDGGRPVAEGVDIHAGTRGRRTRPARTHTHSKM